MIMTAQSWRCSNTVSLISRAVLTLHRVTPRGVFREEGPLTRITSAPRSAAALARAYPIFPLDRLVMNRTGSIGSSVGPAVTRILIPSKSCGVSSILACSRISTGSGRRPFPSVRQANCPSPGAMTLIPLSRNRFRFSCTAGFWNICTFMEGQTRIFAVAATTMVERKSSARPQAILAMKLAVAGATITRSDS